MVANWIYLKLILLNSAILVFVFMEVKVDRPLTLLTALLAAVRGLMSRSTVCPGATFLASRGAGGSARLCASSRSMAPGSAATRFTAGRESARSVEVGSPESLVR